jgi:putative hemolysin
VISGTSIAREQAHLTVVIKNGLAPAPKANGRHTGETNMLTQSFEDWLIGASAAVAVAGTLTLQLLSTPIAAQAVAAEVMQPAYTLTITAHRLPPACKAANAPASYCAQFGETSEALKAH